MTEPSLKAPKEGRPGNSRWWVAEKGEATKQMMATHENLSLNQKGREAKLELFARMYGGLSFMNSMKFSGALSVGAAGQLSVAQSPRYNLGWSLVDTAKSIICKDDTRVTFLTSDADWELQQKAKKLDDYCAGIFYQTEIYDVGEEVFGDCGIFGLGHMKVWQRFDNIDIRRVFPNSLRVDAWDGADRKPRCIYEVWTEDRDVLCAMFPDRTRMIMAAPSVTAVGEYAMNATCNTIAVTESFHLRSSPEAEDGRHIIALSGDDTLLDESYDEDQFPYVTVRWNKLMVGWGGQGLCELLVGHQRELNRTLQVEATSHHIMSVPRVALEINSRVNKNHVTSNKPGPVWWYQGTPPVALNWNAVTGDFVQWKEWIIQSAHDFTGISEMAAQAKKPQGLDSAVAQREFKDTQSDRLAMRQKAYDQMYLQAAQRIISVARHIYSRTGKFPVKVIGRDFVKTIDWSDVAMEDDEFKLKLWPTSMLPKTPAGKLQAVQELLQAGIIDKDTGLRLLNFADLEDTTSLMTSKQENIKSVLDDIVSKGKYRGPDPIQDLQYGLQYAQMLYLKAWDKGVSPERLSSLVQWMAAAVKTPSMMESLGVVPKPVLPAGPGPGAPAAGGTPLAKPTAPPVSQLLPNAPPQQQAA